MLDELLETRLGEWGEAPPYFLALLEALQFRQPDLAPLARLDAAEWNDLLSFCDRAHFTLQLSQLPSGILPAWAALRIQRNVFDNTRRIQRIQATYREAAEAFREVNAEQIVLKGFSQYPDYTRSINLRMQSDIDLYCPPNTILDARDALRRLGYKASPPPGKHVPIDHFPSMSRSGSWRWRGNHYDPEMPPGFELHYCLWNQDRAGFAVPEVEEFWHRRVERNIRGFRVPTLHPVDQLAFCSLHVLRNLTRIDWIARHLHELAYFLHTHANDETFWKDWREMHSPSLRSLESISLSLAATTFGCLLPDAVKEQVKVLPVPVRQWLHCFCASPLKMMFTPGCDGVWLHVALLSTTSAKLRAIRYGLLPSGIPSATVADNTPSFDRKVAPPRYSQKSLRYGAYVLSRMRFYGPVFIGGIAAGFRWWCSQKKLSRSFWKFFAACSLWSLGLSIFFFLFNLFLISLGFSEKYIGGFASALAAGSMTATIPVGWLVKKLGVRKMVLSGFFFAICVFLLRALLFAEAAQWILAFLAGTALSIWGVCIAPALAQLTPEENRPFAFSLVFSSGVGMVALGNFFGGRLDGWLRALLPIHIPSMQAALLVSCAIAALAILPLASVPFEKPSSAPGQREESSESLQFLLRFLPPLALWGLTIGAFVPFATIYFAKNLKMPLPRLGSLFAAAQIFQFLGILAAPVLFRKCGRMRGIAIAETAAALALLIVALLRQPAAAGIVYVLFTAFLWMGEPGIYSALMDSVPPAERSRAAAWNAFTLAIAQGLASLAAGAAIGRFGYHAVLNVAAGIAFLSALLFLRLQPLSPNPRAFLL
jgi:MFS family permease